jgi:hypothetical protein
MISLKKLIYSVPDALEILFEETGKRMEFQDLFPFARDGLLYLSILEDEETIAKSLRLHWENTINQSGAHELPTKSEDFVASMLSKAERQPSGMLVAYIPPCNGMYIDHELYLQNGASCTALPLNEIMLAPQPDASIITYDYGIELHNKKTAFYGVCDHRDHDGLEELLTLGCFNENIETHLEKLLYITKPQLESFWLHLADTAEEDTESMILENASISPTANISVQEIRERVLSEWVCGKGDTIDIEAMEMTQEQIWNELQEVNRREFPPPSESTREKFFKRQTIIKFKSGRRKGA